MSKVVTRCGNKAPQPNEERAAPKEKFAFLCELTRANVVSSLGFDKRHALSRSCAIEDMRAACEPVLPALHVPSGFLAL